MISYGSLERYCTVVFLYALASRQAAALFQALGLQAHVPSGVLLAEEVQQEDRPAKFTLGCCFALETFAHAARFSFVFIANFSST